MAEDIPVGNSAATGLKGDASGFTSPAYTALRLITAGSSDMRPHGIKRARKSEETVPGRARKSPRLEDE